MRRYTGAVITPRSRKSPKRAALAGMPGTAKAKAELFHRLRRAFESAPEACETPERTRERYVEAIDSVTDYLESIGAKPIWIERFDDLSEALEDLIEGSPPALLKPAIPKA
jgi:hypothetical protein